MDNNRNNEQDQNRKYKTQVANIKYGFYIMEIDDEMRILDADNGFYDITGYGADEINEKKLTYRDLIHQEDIDEIILHLKKQFRQGSGVSIEHRILKKSGEVLFVFSYWMIETDWEKHCYRVVITDITHKKMQEKALLDTNFFLKTVTNNIDCGIIKIEDSDNLSILYMNDSFFRLMGFSNKKFMDYSIINMRSLVFPEDLPKLYDRVKNSGKNILNSSLEIRLIRKNNQIFWCNFGIIWIKQLNGEGYYLGTIQNIDYLKRTAQKLYNQNERRRTWEILTNDIIIEYNFNEDCMFCADHSDRMCGDIAIKDYLAKLCNIHQIHEDDLKGYIFNIFESDISNNRIVSYEFRSKIFNKDYKWNKLYFITLLDHHGKKDRLIGRIVDMDSGQEQYQLLEEGIQTDVVTGLVNKTFHRRESDQFLNGIGNAGKHTILMIDLDDFKRIDLTYGHLFADNILENIASFLKQNTQTDDIIGSIEYDRFVILLKNVDEVKAMQKAEELREQLRHHTNSMGIEIELTASVGIVVYPKDGIQYDTLLNKAILALSVAKNAGKNKSVLFEENRKEISMMQFKEKKKRLIDMELVCFSLRALAMSKKGDEAIRMIFEKISQRMGITRIFILQPKQEYGTLAICNLYEMPGYEALIEKMYSFSMEDWKGFDSLGFSEKFISVADCETHGVSDGIKKFYNFIQAKALASCIFLKGFEYMGSIVFVDSQKQRTWTTFEKDTLSEISNIMASVIFSIKEKEEQGKLLANALYSAGLANQYKSKFLSKMSHEIRTPLNAIMGMSTIIRECAGDRKKVEKYIDKLEASSNHLLDLLNDCLDMSKIESGETNLCRQKFSICEMLQELEDTIRIKADSKHQKFEVLRRFPSYLIKGDRNRIIQILMNILTNAVKYTNTNGTIQFTIDEVYRNENMIILRFIVTDNGIGMSSEYLKNIFQPFSQENPIQLSQSYGTGLGMCICKNLIELMNGTIQVESKLRVGTTVTVELPFEVMGKTDDDLIIAEGELTEEEFKGMHILLAEDNELNAEIAQTILRMKGFDVEYARDGQEVFEKFSDSASGFYSMILMDIQMPRVNGLEATKKIRNLVRMDAQTVPIVAMTANALNDDITKALAFGMNDHISKPIDVKRLFAVIRRFCKTQ